MGELKIPKRHFQINRSLVTRWSFLQTFFRVCTNKHLHSYFMCPRHFTALTVVQPIHYLSNILGLQLKHRLFSSHSFWQFLEQRIIWRRLDPMPSVNDVSEVFQMVTRHGLTSETFPRNINGNRNFCINDFIPLFASFDLN